MCFCAKLIISLGQTSRLKLPGQLKLTQVWSLVSIYTSITTYFYYHKILKKFFYLIYLRIKKLIASICLQVNKKVKLLFMSTGHVYVIFNAWGCLDGDALGSGGLLAAMLCPEGKDRHVQSQGQHSREGSLSEPWEVRMWEPFILMELHLMKQEPAAWSADLRHLNIQPRKQKGGSRAKNGYRKIALHSKMRQ